MFVDDFVRHGNVGKATGLREHVRRANIRRRCPILIECQGQVVRSDLFASDAEQPANISMKIREVGWKPFRVRFDDSNSVWVVSTLEYH